MKTPRGVIAVCMVACMLVGCGFKTSPHPTTATVPGEIEVVSPFVYPERVVLQWNVPATNTDQSELKDLSGFKVYRLTQKIGEECVNCEDKRVLHANIDREKPTNAVIAKGAVTYTDSNISTGSTYTYWISAYNLKGHEGPLGKEVAVVLDAPPPPPSALRAEIAKEGVLLQWDAPEQGDAIQGYRVYRGMADKPEEHRFIGKSKGPETRYIDSQAKVGDTYAYAVRSLKMNREVSLESVPSSTLRFAVTAYRPPAPTDVKALATREGMQITWEPVRMGEEAVRYNVYRSESNKPFGKVNTEPLDRSRFLDRRVARGKTYRYTVSSFPKGRPQEESAGSGSEALRYSR